MTEAFDLNSGEVLEHWPTAFAIREVIANALDEQAITGTQPLTSCDSAADAGRFGTTAAGSTTDTSLRPRTPRSLPTRA
jgi:hypothetical protein